MVLQLYAKMYEQIAKIRLFGKLYNFDTNQKILFKIRYDNF